MCATISDDDVGKRVEDANGQTVGTVAAVDGDAVHVDADPSLLDSIRAAFGRESDREGTVSLAADDVGEVTDDAIRIAPDRFPVDESGGHDSVIERDEGRGQRDVGPATGSHDVDGEDDEALAGEGGSDRHADNEDAPPRGDRTVTEERGEGQDR